MSGGKGGRSAPSTSFQTTSTNIPDWMNTAAQGAVGQAQNLAAQPYTPYGGQIVADPTADTNQAYQQVRDMQVRPMGGVRTCTRS